MQKKATQFRSCPGRSFSTHLLMKGGGGGGGRSKVQSKTTTGAAAAKQNICRGFAAVQWTNCTHAHASGDRARARTRNSFSTTESQGGIGSTESFLL